MLLTLQIFLVRLIFYELRLSYHIQVGSQGKVCGPRRTFPENRTQLLPDTGKSALFGSTWLYFSIF
jgi:hypothetical protein